MITPFASVAQDQAQETQVAAPDPRSATMIKADLEFLSDDLLRGRLPEESGYHTAALYVETRLRAIGLEPLSEADTMRDYVALERRTRKPSSDPVTLGNCRLDADSTNLVFSASTTARPDERVNAEAVFVGYGIDAPDKGFDNYETMDVEGKVAVFLNGFPEDLQGELGAHLMLTKVQSALDRGAIATVEVETLASEKRRPWTLIRQTFNGPLTDLAEPIGNTAPLGNRASVRTFGDASNCLFENAGTSLDTVLAQVGEYGSRPASFDLNTSVAFYRENERASFLSPNVVAQIPGPSDRGAIVLLAHLDHIGANDELEGDTIFNGALDNAAGVSIMLDVARQLVDENLNRRIIFGFVTAEESGLIGSAALAERLTREVPGGIDAVINLDMPLLLHPIQDVIAIGADHSTLGQLADRAATQTGLIHSPDPNPQAGRFTRSDHYRFVQRGVPALSIGIGLQGDSEGLSRAFQKGIYHTPADDTSLPINWDSAARLANFVQQLTRLAASTEAPPLWYSDSIFGADYAPSAVKVERPQ